MNKIDLASKPDAPLHYLRFRWSSRKCGDRIRKINVAPVLQKQLKFQTCFASFFFFFRSSSIPVPEISPKGTSPMRNGRPFVETRITIYSNDICPLYFHYFPFSVE